MLIKSAWLKNDHTATHTSFCACGVVQFTCVGVELTPHAATTGKGQIFLMAFQSSVLWYSVKF